MMRRLFVWAVAVCVLGGSAAHAQPLKRFWLTDDGDGPTVRTLHLVQEDGVILASYPILNNGIGRGADSSVAVDPVDGTLWGIKEANPARLVHYTPSGVIEEILLFDDGTSTTSNCTFTDGNPVPWPCFPAASPIMFPEGAAIDFADGAIWIVDDPPSGADDPNSYLYKLRRSDFSQLAKLNLTEVGIVSPQEVAVDPFDGSLWMTDNDNLGPSADPQICNVQVDQTTNTLLPPVCFSVHGLDPTDPDALDSTQGITVDEIDGSVWVTSRFTQKVYNLSTSGTVLGTTPEFPGSLTGVAFAPYIDLGRARTFSVLGLTGTRVRMTEAETTVFGDLGLGPGARQDFFHGVITGNLVVDPTANNSQPNNVVIGGGTVVESLAGAVADAEQAAADAAATTATQVFNKIEGSQTIVGGPREGNFVWVNRIELKAGQTLTLQGAPGALFVVNVTDKMEIKEGARLVLAGGVPPHRVLFNFVSNRAKLELSSGGAATGTFLIEMGKVEMKGTSLLDGALIVGGRAELAGGSQVGSVP